MDFADKADFIYLMILKQTKKIAESAKSAGAILLICFH
ncbi:MAG: hypothetical protein ACJA1N_001160 [Saprospiraceae bacterium]|jgi:hypothetical protein